MSNESLPAKYYKPIGNQTEPAKSWRRTAEDAQIADSSIFILLHESDFYFIRHMRVKDIDSISALMSCLLLSRLLSIEL